jgi:hypothetical protein
MLFSGILVEIETRSNLTGKIQASRQIDATDGEVTVSTVNYLRTEYLDEFTSVIAHGTR